MTNRKSVFFRRAAIVAGLGLIMSACSTQVGHIRAEAVEPPVFERQALSDAAVEIQPVAWTAPKSVSLADRLLGLASDGSVTPRRRAAADAYAAALIGEDDPISRLEADAERQLFAADRLIIAATETLDAIEPRMSDVAVLERAIADLRESRGVYVSTLKSLSDGVDDPGLSDDEAHSLAIDRIKTRFDLAIREIGDLASAIADRAMESNVRSFASPQNAQTELGAF